jgi:hypothetical protein
VFISEIVIFLGISTMLMSAHVNYINLQAVFT